ncbi:hypothetical protein [Hymenobacter aerophilus]|uniref:hypothetical protein n=1 Tax=Hymenobacter aerophilus TaxID=119644 RepID=UPI0012FCD5FD|nr:hypothetical protein [Hymenobacter aerophilus]
MKLLPFILIGLSPCIAKAQEVAVPGKPVEIKLLMSVAEVLSNSVNAKYMVLKSRTSVYHQPADTVNSRHAVRLFPGTKIYIRKYLPSGFMIDLGFAGDERYYLPAKSAKGLQTFVEI